MKRHARTATVRRGSALTFLVVLLSACDGGAGPPAPDTRTSDGLLLDVELQRVVDLQVARDGAGLIEALSDERPEVRARAALGLGSVQDPAALSALAEVLLDDADASARRDAAFALGQLDAPEAVTALAATLEGEADAEVRLRVIEALGKTSAVQAGATLLGADVRAGEAGPRALALAVNSAVKGQGSQPGIEFLLSRLASADPAEREGAAYFFGRTDVPASWAGGIDRVREALDGYSPEDPAAMYLVQALGKSAAPEDQGRLETWAATAADWRIRTNAAAALRGYAAEGSTVEVLLDALNDEVPLVALTAAGSLEGRAHPPTAVEGIKAWLTANPDRPATAEPLLRTLAAQNEREAVFAWMDAAGDDEERMEAGLRAALFLQGRDAFDRIAEVAAAGTSASDAAVAALGRRWAADRRDPALHPVYFQILRTALASGDLGQEFAAGQTLTDPLFRPMGSTALFIDAYQRFASREDPRIAGEMLRLMALASDPMSEPILREALEHPAAVVRTMAANGLERVTGTVVEVDAAPDAPSDDDGSAGRLYDPTVIDWGFLESIGTRPRLVFETTKGRIVFELSTEEAPQTVQTMIRLAAEGALDDTPFHRVIANFVAQGGDVSGRDGQGGAGFSIRSEFNGLAYVRGAIGMASAGKDTESSQFFVAHTRLPHLDGGYTVFGWVVEGIDVVDAIVPRDRLLSATFEPGS